MPNKPKKKAVMPPIEQLQKALDNMVIVKAKLLQMVESTAEYKKLQEVDRDLADMVSELKKQAEKKGDFETKYYRFTNVDRRSVDYKSLMEELVEDKKATPKYLAKFVKISHSVQATLLKENVWVPTAK